MIHVHRHTIIVRTLDLRKIIHSGLTLQCNTDPNPVSKGGTEESTGTVAIHLTREVVGVLPAVIMGKVAGGRQPANRAHVNPWQTKQDNDTDRTQNRNTSMCMLL